MLDQDARPETAPLSEPSSSGTVRSSRGWAALFVAIVVIVGAIAFAVGRATDSKSTARAVTTRNADAGAGGAAKAGATARPAAPAANVPTSNIDEIQENRPDKPLDNATRDALAADLVTAREVSAKYPTVASARAAGLLQAGDFAPGAGAHFIDLKNTGNEIRPDGSVDVTKPGSYIYDGISPTSRLVGLMYLSLSDGAAPAGFPGPNDHWHRHANLCIKYGATIEVPFAPDRDVTKAQCDTVHGQFMKKTVWMVHAWVVPGWESPKGVFSHSNPNLPCADGTMNTDAVGFCKGT